jgi:hypothetical protein
MTLRTNRRIPAQYRVGRAISRQPPSGRLLFSSVKSLLEAGCRLIARPRFESRKFGDDIQ